MRLDSKPYQPPEVPRPYPYRGQPMTEVWDAIFDRIETLEKAVAALTERVAELEGWQKRIITDFQRTVIDG